MAEGSPVFRLQPGEERRGGLTHSARLAAIFTLSCAAVCLVGVCLIDMEGTRMAEGRDELTFCASPPCGPYGQLSPHISFHIHQQLSPGPHPMTMAAIQKANDASSLAIDVQNEAAHDHEKLEDVNDFTDDTKAKVASDLSASRVELWKVVGKLRRKIASYKSRLAHAKSQMMSRDNYLAARMHSLDNSIVRNGVAVERRVNDVKVKMAVVENMQGPPGQAGPDGLNGADGPAGPPGQRGDLGQSGTMGPAGPRGYDGRDGAPGGIGPQGDMGIPGPTGPHGAPGRVGRTGPMGPLGISGVGQHGIAGPSGASGPPGYPGVQGPQGPTGGSTPGAMGVAGAPGPAGSAGQPGPPGSAGPGGGHGIGGGLIWRSH